MKLRQQLPHTREIEVESWNGHALATSAAVTRLGMVRAW